MPRSIVSQRAGALLSLLSMGLCAQPAAAARDHRLGQTGETRTAAFAGATFRIPFGRQADRPQTRLQLGLRSVSIDSQSAAPSRVRHVPAVEFGVDSRETGTLYLAGQSRADIERRLALRGNSTVTYVFGAALLVVGLIVITSLDDLGDSGAE